MSEPETRKPFPEQVKELRKFYELPPHDKKDNYHSTSAAIMNGPWGATFVILHWQKLWMLINAAEKLVELGEEPKYY